MKTKIKRKRFQNKIKLLMLIGFLCLFISPTSDSLGASHNEDIKIKIDYLPATKLINLSIVNIGNMAITIYHSDLKSKDFSLVPSGLEVRLKNKKGKIISENVFGSEGGFISSYIFAPKLFSWPLSPSFEVRPNETIKLEISLEKLLWGYDRYIEDLSQIEYIQLRYIMALGPDVNSLATYITEWLPYNEK
ncbi:MAG: hypothetical protein OEZ01_11870 [Candidatus Heimdallarchaeota archaeon]|nr:hypothetical protein [Candidatus Heimdallarchaeota archaeon]